MCDEKSDAEPDTNDDELDCLPHVTLPNGKRVIVLIEPRRPYLAVARGSPDSSSALAAPTPPGACHQDGPNVTKSPTTGKLRLITAERPRTRRTTD